jgi:hypothetical protein
MQAYGGNGGIAPRSLNLTPWMEVSGQTQPGTH